jgi:acetyl esterase/lipase
MLVAIFDICRAATVSLGSMLYKPTRHPARSWLSEFTFRFIKYLIDKASVRPATWLRDRQNLLKLYAGDQNKVTCQNENIGGVDCLVTVPKSLPDPDNVIIYFHGGGYNVGSPEGYRLTMAKIALASEARVIGVKYRLAPEYEIPAAQEDCLAVTEALIDASSGKKLSLMGDSAGGALCLATLKALSNADLHKKISSCVLISPWIEPLDIDALAVENESTDILGRHITHHWKQNFYAGNSQDTYLVHDQVDATILPKLYIQAAGAEVFISQINRLVARLEKAECDLSYEVFEGQFHVFQTFAPLVREADDALSKIGAFVRQS